MTILQQTCEVLNEVDWHLGKDISINKCWHVTDGYKGYLRTTVCIHVIHTTYFFTGFLATEFLTKSIRSHMLSEGLTALHPKKAFVGGIHENHSRKVLNKCSSWLTEEVHEWSELVQLKNVLIYFPDRIFSNCVAFCFIKAEPWKHCHYLWEEKNIHAVGVIPQRCYRENSGSSGMSQVTTLHWPQAVMLNTASNIRCNVGALLASISAFSFPVSVSNAGDVVCDQWLRHHEVRDPRATWSSPGEDGEGKCPGSSLWSSDTKFKIIKSHKFFKALNNSFPPNNKYIRSSATETGKCCRKITGGWW